MPKPARRKQRVPLHQDCKLKTYSLSAKTANQKTYIKTINRCGITFCIGPAGTGKTHIAVASGILRLMRKECEKIIITRPFVQAGENSGFLPGDIQQKADPYMRPIYDELNRYCSLSDIQRLINDGKVEILPFAYMRGRNLHNSFIVADECVSGNTLIHIENYRKPLTIQRVVDKFNEGEKLSVLGFDGYTTSYQPLTKIYQSGIKQTYYIYIAGKIKPIECTHNHPFATYTQKGIVYKDANQLSPDDIVLRYKKSNTNNNSVVCTNMLDIIAGFILGDGSLPKSKQKIPAYRLMKTHGLAQYDYMIHCADIFKGVERTGLKSGYTQKPLCGFTTKNIVLPSSFIDSFYQDGVKRLTSDIRQWITHRTLAYWYMDDGNLGTNYCRLHTEGFSYDECVILKDILWTQFNIRCNINKSKNKYYILSITFDRHKFFQLIAPYVHKSMEYKLPIEYHNKQTSNTFIPYYENICGTTIQSVESNATKQEVFNLEIANHHTFFADNILTHNCQNATFEQITMLLTRIGQNSKMVLTGDLTQTDLEQRNSGGLERYVTILGNFDDEISVVKLSTQDIVRSPIVELIVKAVEEYHAQEKATQKEKTTYPADSQQNEANQPALQS